MAIVYGNWTVMKRCISSHGGNMTHEFYQKGKQSLWSTAVIVNYTYGPHCSVRSRYMGSDRV